MAYTIPDGLRDREFSKFVASPNGSQVAINVNVVSGVNLTIGSVSASVDSVYVQSGNVAITGSVETFGSTNTRLYKHTTTHAVGSEAVWVSTGGTKAVISDVVISTGSLEGTNEVSIYAGGSQVARAYLAANGGFVTNLQTPFETQTNGSVFVETLNAGSTAITLTGYEE